VNDDIQRRAPPLLALQLSRPPAKGVLGTAGDRGPQARWWMAPRRFAALAFVASGLASQASHRTVTTPVVPPLPPRRFDQQPEGASLRNMIQLYSTPLESASSEGGWQVVYDPDTGFPYYHDRETGQTQWDNPWVADLAGDAGILRQSWRVYERFEFVGTFDELTAVRHRRQLPRAAPRFDAMRSIAKMAGMQFDVAQARLEVALLKAETLAGIAGAEASSKPDQLAEAFAPDGEHAEFDHDVLNMAMEDEPPDDLTDAAAAAPTAPRGQSHPPLGTSPGTRVALAGGWNDLANMWYSRGEWEMAVECFRRSLFWNPEQTASLINLASLLVKLGFERDAAVVWDYFVDIDGGTMGGWTAEREEHLVSSIEEGIRLAASLPNSGGRTLGELRLQGEVPEADTIQVAAHAALAARELAGMMAAIQGDEPALPLEPASRPIGQEHPGLAPEPEDVPDAADSEFHGGGRVLNAQQSPSGVAATSGHARPGPGVPAAGVRSEETAGQGAAGGQSTWQPKQRSRPRQHRHLGPQSGHATSVHGAVGGWRLAALEHREGAKARADEVGAQGRASKGAGLRDYARSTSGRLAMDPLRLWDVLRLPGEAPAPASVAWRTWVLGWTAGIGAVGCAGIWVWNLACEASLTTARRSKRRRLRRR